VDGTAVLVKFTYAGDATLDGKINIDDYTRIDTGIANGLTSWSNGDFNYDGKINIDDYTIIDANVPQASAPLGNGSSADFAVAVPEPTAGLSAALIGAPALWGRRGRRRKRSHDPAR